MGHQGHPDLRDAGAHRRADRLPQAILQPGSFRPRREGHRPPIRPQGAYRRTAVGPLRDAAARHGRGDDPRAQRLCHRLGRRAHGAGQPGRLRPRRFHRLHHRVRPVSGLEHACDRGVPACRSGARRRRADGVAQRSDAARLADADGRPDRHPPQRNGGQQAGQEPSDGLVREQCHQQRAVPQSRLHAQGLSRLHPADRLHADEPGAAHERRTRTCSAIW